MKTNNLLLLSLITACAVCAQSCSTVSSAITGLPIPATAVQRAGHDESVTILISSADYALAEQAPAGTVHGLYDAGYLSARAREVVIEAVK